MESLNELKISIEGMRNGQYVVDLSLLAIQFNRLAADVEKLEAAQQSVQSDDATESAEDEVDPIVQALRNLDAAIAPHRR